MIFDNRFSRFLLVFAPLFKTYWCLFLEMGLSEFTRLKTVIQCSFKNAQNAKSAKKLKFHFFVHFILSAWNIVTCLWTWKLSLASDLFCSKLACWNFRWVAAIYCSLNSLQRGSFWQKPACPVWTVWNFSNAIFWLVTFFQTNLAWISFKLCFDKTWFDCEHPLLLL